MARRIFPVFKTSVKKYDENASSFAQTAGFLGGLFGAKCGFLGASVVVTDNCSFGDGRLKDISRRITLLVVAPVIGGGLGFLIGMNLPLVIGISIVYAILPETKSK